MKALVKAAAGPGFVLKDVPRPSIRDDEVLIRVRRAGVCGTDVHIYDWDAWAQGACKPPFVVGHEFAGDVVQVGKPRDRRARGRPRDRRGTHRVTAAAMLCRTGNAHVCPNTRIIGVDRDGCFAEYIAMPATNVWHLDDSDLVRHRRHPRSDGQRVPHGADGTEIPGSTVLVTGCGPIGIFAVGICKAAGASRIIATRRERRRGSRSRARWARTTPCTPQEAEAAVQRRHRTARRGRRARDVRRAERDSSGVRARARRRPRADARHSRQADGGRLRDRDHLQGHHDLWRRRPPDVRHVASR